MNITSVFSGCFSKCAFSMPIIKYFRYAINICNKRRINISEALSIYFIQTGATQLMTKYPELVTQILQTSTIDFTCRCYRNPVIREQPINYVEYCIKYIRPPFYQTVISHIYSIIRKVNKVVGQ